MKASVKLRRSTGTATYVRMSEPGQAMGFAGERHVRLVLGCGVGEPPGALQSLGVVATTGVSVCAACARHAWAGW